MKKYSVKASIALLFAAGAMIGMEQRSPKRIYLKNELSPMQIIGYGTSNYTLVCIIDDIDDPLQQNYTKYVPYGNTVELGLSNEIKTLKIRLSGPGSGKGLYIYDYLTDELQKQIEAKAFDENSGDLTIIVKHYYTNWGIWVPKQYDYEWKWGQTSEGHVVTPSLKNGTELNVFPGAKNIQNLYKRSLFILGVNPKADDILSEAKKGYLKLALKWHPDKFANESPEKQAEALGVLQLVVGAYEYVKYVQSHPSK